jgi:hypothetical protein
MKTKTKVLLILLAVGVVGVAVTMGYIVGSGTLISREAEKTYAISEPFDTVAFDTTQAQVTVLPAEDGETRIEAYAKAWLPEEIDMDVHVSVAVQDGALVVTETPFPDEFLGVFPQPYELILRVYVPQDVYERWTGGQS